MDQCVLKVDVNIEETLNLKTSEIYVGFTAATGGLSENHDILSWEFSS